MTRCRSVRLRTSQSSVIDEAWLIGVAEGASQDSGGVSTEFLAGYLPMLVDAATIGRAPKRTEIDAVRLQGRKAAESGVPVGRGVDLYLSAARRVWDELPAVIRRRDGSAVRAAAEALLQVLDEAVASFADGHAEAGRELIRKEETLRRDLVDDLLRGDANLSELVGPSGTLRPRPDPRPSGRPRPTRAATSLDRGRHQRPGTSRPGPLR